ncbi:DUF7522 family protein [Halobaculum sp. D14]|uniref:DUF7522 family protein n=1 Tax=Halobaculum sp. D14 TaxID=3421642 RepID=UPI003EBF4009
MSEINGRLREEVGDDLRIVARFDGDVCSFQYLREDLSTRLDEDDLDPVHQCVVFDVLERPYFERVFATAGGHEATIRQFEHAYIFEIPTGHHHGVLVSVDRGVDESLPAVFDLCRAAIQ